MKPLVNISIDDVSPHPQSSIKVVDRCFELIKAFPDIKFTLFVPMAYWRTVGETATASPLQIDLYPEFCDQLRQLPKENFELAYHGLHHGIKDLSNNDEMALLSYEDARLVIDSMILVANRSGLFDEFKRILRPPAWRMSAACFDVCRERGIEILALSPDDYAQAFYGEKVEEFGRVVYYNVAPPFKPLRLFDRTEIVYHACEWDKNFLGQELMEQLRDFLAGKDVEFVFMHGLV